MYMLSMQMRPKPVLRSWKCSYPRTNAVPHTFTYPDNISRRWSSLEKRCVHRPTLYVRFLFLLRRYVRRSHPSTDICCEEGAGTDRVVRPASLRQVQHGTKAAGARATWVTKMTGHEVKDDRSRDLGHESEVKQSRGTRAAQVRQDRDSNGLQKIARP